MQTAQHIIDRLALRLHPEGGWYSETWREDCAPNDRSVCSAIYYLLEAARHQTGIGSMRPKFGTFMPERLCA